MTVTRRGLLVSAVGAAAIPLGFGLGGGMRERPVADLSGLVPPDADILLLARVGDDDATLRRLLGQRTGRTAIRPVVPLASFGDLASLLDRASGVYVLALADVAGLLVIDTLLHRAGATPLRKATAIGDVSLARL